MTANTNHNFSIGDVVINRIPGCPPVACRIIGFFDGLGDPIVSDGQMDWIACWDFIFPVD